MNTNTRFSVAVHILTLLAMSPAEPLSSEAIAGSVNTNPVVVRRILGALGKAGLTQSQLGAGGGALLARQAGAINLRDVYRAVDDGELFTLPARTPNPRCACGRHILPIISGVFDEAASAAERVLAATTIAQLADEIRQRAAA
ncbi:MAG TPA: Rrf2 family transcriptional regulator [Herpetosiphonaceae bacterium]